MPENFLYTITNDLVYSALNKDTQGVIKSNRAFNHELWFSLCSNEEWTSSSRLHSYDLVRRLAKESVNGTSPRKDILRRMQEEFDKLDLSH